MTKIFVACKKCEPSDLMPHIQKRKFTFSEGQTDIWTCVHVITYESKHLETFEKISR